MDLAAQAPLTSLELDTALTSLGLSAFSRVVAARFVHTHARKNRTHTGTDTRITDAATSSTAPPAVPRAAAASDDGTASAEDDDDGDSEDSLREYPISCLPHALTWMRELADMHRYAQDAAADDAARTVPEAGVTPELNGAADGGAAAVRRRVDPRSRYPASVLRPPTHAQRGCPEVLPGLQARPFWSHAAVLACAHGGDAATAHVHSHECYRTVACDRVDVHPVVLQVLNALRLAYPDIRREVLSLRGNRLFQPYRAPVWNTRPRDGLPADAEQGLSRIGSGRGEGTPAGHAERRSHGMQAAANAGATTAIGARGTDRGDWNVMYLQLHNARGAMTDDTNVAACPVTNRVLSDLGWRNYQHAMFSAMSPGTHITPHTGPTNKKIRFQLPLLVPERGRSRIRVGNVVHILAEGEPFAFDDSFQHEAWHDHPEEPRIVLIFDIWHPDLSESEVKLLSFVRGAQMRQAKAARAHLEAPSSGVPAEDVASADFYAVLEQAARTGADDDAVFGRHGADSDARRTEAPAPAGLVLVDVHGVEMRDD